jgi:hypothetical protein
MNNTTTIHSFRLFIIAIVLLFFSQLGFGQQPYKVFNATGAGRLPGASPNITDGGLSGSISYSSGIYTWTVPFDGDYRIEVAGARGGSGTYNGGSGAKIKGDFSLNSGDVIYILAGQHGEDHSSSNCDTGGGGGTFVVIKDDSSSNTFITKSVNVSPLIIAGGGGGASRTNGSWSDGISSDGNGQGGTSGWSAAGGGFLTNGGASSNYSSVAEAGHSFLSGGLGGNNFAYNAYRGGFGGGSSGHGNCCIGGGCRRWLSRR